MEKLKNINTLLIRQVKEWGEILTGFEQKNKYSITDQNGQEIYFAAETGGSFIGRIFLKALRPFTVEVLNRDGSNVITVRRPFKFFFHECEVFDKNNIPLGKVKWNFAIIRKKYTAYGPNGEEKFRLFAPVLKPWTFRIMKNDQEIGVISKKWSGLMKEAFTDADNFGISFPAEWDIKTKALAIGSVFLIDFVHFENKNN